MHIKSEFNTCIMQVFLDDYVDTNTLDDDSVAETELTRVQVFANTGAGAKKTYEAIYETKASWKLVVAPFQARLVVQHPNSLFAGRGRHDVAFVAADYFEKTVAEAEEGYASEPTR